MSRKNTTHRTTSVSTQRPNLLQRPPYGAAKRWKCATRGEVLYEGVYRIDAPGKVSRIIGHEVERANGLFVSPDDKYLYVADNNNNNTGGARKLWRFTLRPDGSIVPDSRKLIFDWQDGRGPDGLKMDREGRLYVAAGRNEPNKYESVGKYKGGVYVLSPAGKLLSFIPIPKDEVTNCAFSGSDWKTLFITRRRNSLEQPRRYTRLDTVSAPLAARSKTLAKLACGLAMAGQTKGAYVGQVASAAAFRDWDDMIRIPQCFAINRLQSPVLQHSYPAHAAAAL